MTLELVTINMLPTLIVVISQLAVFSYITMYLGTLGAMLISLMDSYVESKEYTMIEEQVEEVFVVPAYMMSWPTEEELEQEVLVQVLMEETREQQMEQFIYQILVQGSTHSTTLTTEEQIACYQVLGLHYESAVAAALA